MTDPGDRLRDQFFAGWPGAPRPPLEPLDAPPITSLQGLSLSFFPTIRFRQLRFLVATDLDDTIRPRFARPCPALPELAAVFVDPAELSYRSFENIVGLDHLFTDLGVAPIHFTDVHELAAGVTQLRFQTSDPLRARLAQLDELGLHIPPFDSSRGGHRFIFHSAGLAAAPDRRRGTSAASSPTGLVPTAASAGPATPALPAAVRTVPALARQRATGAGRTTQPWLNRTERR